MYVMHDSASETQVGRFLLANGQHTHGSRGAGHGIERIIERMIGIVKHRTIARHFHAFTIGECFGFSVGAHDVVHIH